MCIPNYLTLCSVLCFVLDPSIDLSLSSLILFCTMSNFLADLSYWLLISAFFTQSRMYMFYRLKFSVQTPHLFIHFVYFYSFNTLINYFKVLAYLDIHEYVFIVFVSDHQSLFLPPYLSSTTTTSTII